MVKSAPDIEQAIRNSRQVSDFTIEADYSCSMNQAVGDGWVLLGDAACFADPIFSSGVSVAIYSAKFASERIIEAFETGDFSQQTLGPYETVLREAPRSNTSSSPSVKG